MDGRTDSVGLSSASPLGVGHTFWGKQNREFGCACPMPPLSGAGLQGSTKIPFQGWEDALYNGVDQT